VSVVSQFGGRADDIDIAAEWQTSRKLNRIYKKPEDKFIKPNTFSFRWNIDSRTLALTWISLPHIKLSQFKWPNLEFNSTPQIQKNSWMIQDQRTNGELSKQKQTCQCFWLMIRQVNLIQLDESGPQLLKGIREVLTKFRFFLGSGQEFQPGFLLD